MIVTGILAGLGAGLQKTILKILNNVVLIQKKKMRFKRK
jgi:hypothetical protein